MVFLPVLYCAPIQGSGFFLVAGFDDGFRGPFEKLVGRIESAPPNPLSGEEWELCEWRRSLGEKKEEGKKRGKKSSFFSSRVSRVWEAPN